MNSTAPGSNSDSSFVNCAAAARVCAGSAGGAEVGDGAGGFRRRQRAPQLRQQRIQCGGDLAQRGFRFGCGGPVANEFLQHAGGRLHRLGADVPGHAFEGVGEALGESRVALGQRGGDLLDRRSLLLRELAEEFQIELLIARDPGQAILGIEAFKGREVRDCAAARISWHSASLSPAEGDARSPKARCGCRLVEPAHRLEQQRRINGFGDVVVHAGRQAALPLLNRRVGGHGEDRQVGKPRVGANFRRGLVAVHLGHLEVHEDQVESGGARP